MQLIDHRLGHRLAPALFALGVLVTTAAAHADTGFVSKLQVYSDSDRTTVVSPMVSATADLDPNTGASIGYVADVVSSASIDIVSQASPTTIHDTRHQLSLGGNHTSGDWTGRVGYSFSTENDYRSNTGSLGIEKTFDDKNTTIGAGYNLSLNRVGRADDMNFSRDLTVQSLTFSWTQVISPRTATQVTYELGDASGFQASPYRFVPVRAAVTDAPMYTVAETDPDQRYRHAIVGAINHAVGKHGSVQADYRLYHDTWGITSNTLGLRYFVDLSSRVELRLRSRLYQQNGTSFYQSNYATTLKYMTIDRELSPLWSETVGGKLMLKFGARAEAELKMDLFYYHYADFPALQSRTGANIGLGVSIDY
ncbi:MAG: DUF3570 domain-containing protein [Deltaproteobacteria bacterium]|nr:DUF3570 domain-containing protein [Deltaproteobacteria bacterium]